MARMPLMAGNWKMNLTHLEAIAHVQKLAFSLNDRTSTVVEVAVLPPFTAIRSVQTLVDGDKYRIRYGAQDVSRTRRAPTPATCPGRCWPSSAAPTSWSATRSGGSTTSEDDASGQRQGQGGMPHDLTPILCVGEARGAARGRHVEHTTWQLRAALRDITVEDVRTWSSPTSRCGRSAPGRSPPR
jgi:triosephosphate isomerase